MHSVVERKAQRRQGRVNQPRESEMNAKQQFATGFLALVIVGSITFMPVNAGQKDTNAAPVRPQASTVQVQNSPELPQDQVRDLTYN
jgi:hypothetical protein